METTDYTTATKEEKLFFLNEINSELDFELEIKEEEYWDKHFKIVFDTDELTEFYKAVRNHNDVIQYNFGGNELEQFSYIKMKNGITVNPPVMNDNGDRDWSRYINRKKCTYI